MKIATSVISNHHITLAETLILSSIVAPINTVAPPPTKHRHVISRRSLRRTRRRTRRRSPPSSDDESPFLDDGGNIFGGGSWNFGGGGSNWSGGDGWFGNDDEFDRNNNSRDDPAFDFVFEVVCWIVFTNCLHFACKKIVRLVSEERRKVPLQMAASVCLD